MSKKLEEVFTLDHLSFTCCHLCCFLLAALMMSSLYQTITDGIFCLISISAVSLVACTYLFVYLVFVVLLLLCIGICKFLDGCFHD